MENPKPPRLCDISRIYPQGVADPTVFWHTYDMAINTRNQITEEARFFLEPGNTLHRQYEALRAYFADGLPSHEVARRFGYTPGSFRVLCHKFRHDTDLDSDRFFREIQRGPQCAPARDEVRDLVVSMRKRNLSVYDIRRELQEMGHGLSINSLSILLQEEGFARLPRRKDEERPPTTKPDAAPVADVRTLDLSPREFRTRVAGLFFFVPLMKAINLATIAAEMGLPGSQMIPPEQALRSMLALKLIGKERKSHVMNIVDDEGLALFAGLNAIPKRSYLASYSSRIGRKRNVAIMEIWFQHVQTLGLHRKGSLDVDFHTIPANTGKEPLGNHYISKRSRSEKGILVFLARDAEERVMCYSNAAIPREKRADEILLFVDFWKKQTGHVPGELVFDSQLTTHDHLRRLDDQGIHFITLRRRSPKMLAQIYGYPRSAWKRITLQSLTRTYRNPRVLDQRLHLKGYGKEKEIRQVTVIDLGHEEPTVILTNNFDITPANLVTRYAKRMLIENGIAEAIHFFHIDALSSMISLKVDFDLQLTLMGSALYRLLANRLASEYKMATAKTIFSSLLDVGGRIAIGEEDICVTLDKRAHNPFLVDSGLADHPTPMPCLENKNLIIRFS